MLFFLPLETVLEWAGAPKGHAAKLRWMGEQLGIKIKGRLDDKTLRKLFRSDEHTFSHTRETFDQFVNSIEGALGRDPLPAAIPDGVIGTSVHWHEWLNLADYEDVNLPMAFLPRTRRLIRELATAERELMVSIRRSLDLREAMIAIVDNQLARTLCPEIEPAQILKSLPELKRRADLERFRISNPLLKKWYLHCVASLLLNILASADLEFMQNHILEEGAPGKELQQRSAVLRLLPQIIDGKLELPIPALLNCWKEFLGIPSIRQIAANIPGSTALNQKAKMWSRWLKGKHLPDAQSMQGILDRLVKHEAVRELAFRRYRIALLLTRLYRTLEKAWPESTIDDRVRLFQTFTEHRLKLLSELEQAAPARR